MDQQGSAAVVVVKRNLIFLSISGYKSVGLQRK